MKRPNHTPKEQETIDHYDKGMAYEVAYGLIDSEIAKHIAARRALSSSNSNIEHHRRAVVRLTALQSKLDPDNLLALELVSGLLGNCGEGALVEGGTCAA
jgi:hypothetical protein